MNQEYLSRMLDLARRQREVLNLRYDYKTKMPYPLATRRKGLFGREVVYDQEYLDKKELLEGERKELLMFWETLGYPSGMYWWNLPWEHLEPKLLWNLALPEEEDEPDETGWRRAYHLNCSPGKGENRLLCLMVEGHWQGRTSSSRKIHDTEISSYSKQERDQMERDYNSKKNRSALSHMAFANDVGVHSISTGWDYNTAYDYYTSSEYLADRMRASENYSQSLYTIQENNVLSVGVSSTDYGCVNGVAEFHVDGSGTLDFAAMLDFARFQTAGEVPEKKGMLIEGKEAAVLWAAYMSLAEPVKKVPVSLFNNRADQWAETYEEALMQAQIFTCLADKLEMS